MNQINNPLPWTIGFPYKNGDLFTLQGRYKRRTFLEWYFNEPPKLQVFRIIGDASVLPSGITKYERHNG